MPGSTATSLATLGYGAQFFTGAGSPIVYTAVLEIKSIKLPELTVPSVNVSHLMSPNATEEKIAGIISPGTVELSGNYIADPTQLIFESLQISRTVIPFKITSLIQISKSLTVLGYAFVSKITKGPLEMDKTIEITVTLEVSGLPVYTVV